MRPSQSPPRSRSPPAPHANDDAAAIDHIRVAIKMGEEVCDQMIHQGLYAEVGELRGMIEMLKSPLQSAGNLSQAQLEGIIEEAQLLIAKLLSFGPRT